MYTMNRYTASILFTYIGKDDSIKSFCKEFESWANTDEQGAIIIKNLCNSEADKYEPHCSYSLMFIAKQHKGMEYVTLSNKNMDYASNLLNNEIKYSTSISSSSNPIEQG